MKTPVALIIFNRAEATAHTAEVIAQARPPKVFVFADGPRANHPEDAEKCAATRAVIDRLSWPCEVVKRYSDANLGCGVGPTTGLNWVFEQTDRAIILEDDCVAHPSFFGYCDELLEKFRDDERVMQIAGSNFQCGHQRGEYSYFFSKFKICWGWATWRRAWRHMDMSVKLWPRLRESTWLLELTGDSRVAQHWAEQFERAYQACGIVDYWDYQWLFATWVQNGLCVMPNVNMISNIGFNEEATHTTWTESRWARLPLQQMMFPLLHPPFVMRDREADEYFIQQVVAAELAAKETFLQRVQKKVRGAYTAAVPESARLILRNLRSSI